MDEVLRGESTNLREPSDLIEVQGRYGRVFQRCESQEGQDHRIYM
jgi:hypothetical protein